MKFSYTGKLSATAVDAGKQDLLRGNHYQVEITCYDENNSPITLAGKDVAFIIRRQRQSSTITYVIREDDMTISGSTATITLNSGITLGLVRSYYWEFGINFADNQVNTLAYGAFNFRPSELATAIADEFDPPTLIDPTPWLETMETNLASSESAKTGALASEVKAGKWAEENEDIEVEVGKHSAKHHSAKAEGFKTEAEAAATQAGIEATEAGESASDAKKHAQETEPYTDSDDITYDKGAKGYKQDAEAAASQAEGEVNTHEAKTTDVHGVTSPDAVESTAGAQGKVDTHEGKDVSVSVHPNANAHIDAAAPHSGHETPAGAQSKVDTHEAKAAPHAGHETPAGAQAKVDTHKASVGDHDDVDTSGKQEGYILRFNAQGNLVASESLSNVEEAIDTDPFLAYVIDSIGAGATVNDIDETRKLIRGFDQ